MTDFWVTPDWQAYCPTRMDRLRARYALWRLRHGGPIICFSCRKVGGITFVKLGRLTFSFCISKAYRPL